MLTEETKPTLCSHARRKQWRGCWVWARASRKEILSHLAWRGIHVKVQAALFLADSRKKSWLLGHKPLTQASWNCLGWLLLNCRPLCVHGNLGELEESLLTWPICDSQTQDFGRWMILYSQIGTTSLKQQKDFDPMLGMFCLESAEEVCIQLIQKATFWTFGESKTWVQI